MLEQIERLKTRIERDRAGLHYVEGVRAVLQAIDSGIPIDTLVWNPILLQNPVAQKQIRLSRRAGVSVTRVSPEEFRSVSTTLRASGIGAVVRQHWTPLERADSRRGLCWIALSRIRSAGNLGSIVRTAEAAGAGGLILLGAAVDPFDPAVVRASMGGMFRLSFVRTTLEAFAAWTSSRGCRVIGASPAAALSYTEVPVRSPLVVMFGEERLGLAPEEQRLCTHLARIPIVGRADSLNVGVAAGVMLYEILRRGGRRPDRPNAFGIPPLQSARGIV